MALADGKEGLSRPLTDVAITSNVGMNDIVIGRGAGGTVESVPFPSCTYGDASGGALGDLHHDMT